MGYPTTVQLIARKSSEQWYVNFPAALARALDFEKGEVVTWTIETRRRLVLNRTRHDTKQKAQRTPAPA